jgi:hypothetical protein
VIALQLLPVVLSLLVLAAHFLRAGHLILVVLCLALLGLLAVPRAWAARTVQVALLLGAIEWVWTLSRLASARAEAGEPALRMTLILGAVALLTGLSALLFRTARLRRRFRGQED